MSEDRYTRITLRIPKKVHKSLQEAADARSHSMNAEIVQRLEESFSQSASHGEAQEHVIPVSNYRASVEEVGKFFIIANAMSAKKNFIEKLENVRAIRNGLKVDKIEEEIAERSLKAAEISYEHSLKVTRDLGIFSDELLIGPDEIQIEDSTP